MSAHREPDTVAEYAKNAQMRGLRVIIAGAGLSAALPGVVAAHTALPVIGVPLDVVEVGGRRARRAAVDRPDAARRARRVRGRGQRAQRGRARRAHPGLLIARYTRPELGEVWTDEARMAAWRDVEVAAAEALDGPSPEDLEAIRAATFTVEAVREREAVTDHDVAAFVDVLSASAGPAGRWIHFGLTSSDVLDTALALQLRRAGEVIVPGAYELARALAERAREHARHAVRRPHARGARRADLVRPQARRLRDGGAPQRRAAGARRSRRRRWGRSRGRSAPTRRSGRSSRRGCSSGWGSPREPVSTQVVPRDRHAELLNAIALAGAGLERFALEIRHLQRTEVREVEEPFRAGQKGSSAMPHKRNPITTERICGLARVLRGYAVTGLENVALWHERDISHSGAERVVLPDATTLLDYMQHLALRVVRGMVVHADRMAANLELTSGALFSQRVLLALVEGGMQRDDAYRVVQRLAQEAWDTGTPLRSLLEREGLELDLDAIFDYGHYVRSRARGTANA